MLPMDRIDEFDRVVELLQNGKPVRDYEAVARHKDGSRVEVLVMASLVRVESGQPVDVCSIARDNRVKKQLEQQITLLAEAERRYIERQVTWR